MSDDNKMPDAVKLAIKELLSAASFYRLEAQRDDRPIAAADALDSWWRNSAQPVALGMTPELERVLRFAWAQACETDGYTQPRVEADVLAVRQQAAQPVRLEKVPVAEIRSVVEIVKRTHCDSRVTQQIEAWLDAAEGKGEGRG